MFKNFKGTRKIYFTMMISTCLLLSSIFVFADMQKKLEGHWSKTLLNEKFISQYLPDLAENDFAKLNPKAYTAKSDIMPALNSLYKKYDKEQINVPPEDLDKALDRMAVLELLIPMLEDVNHKIPTAVQIVKYDDCEMLMEDQLNRLSLLSEYGIIKGVSKTSFAPKRVMTQSEMIIILQRVQNFLERQYKSKRKNPDNQIPYKIIGQKFSFDKSEGFLVHQKGDVISIEMTKRFPTPGYSLEIESITANEKGVNIKIKTNSPASDTETMQVITYQSLFIEIQKSDIPANTAMNFFVEGMGYENM